MEINSEMPIEDQITILESKITKFESSLENTTKPEDISYFRQRLLQLSEEKHQLREKEHQLREEKR